MAEPTAPVDVAALKGKKWLKGPLDEQVLKRLLRRGLVTGDSYVWSPELAELLPTWQLAKETLVFGTTCVLWQTLPQWYYYDQAKQQKGPVTTADLSTLFLDGDIDGLTLVWSSAQLVPAWTPMGQVDVLKEVLQEINDEVERKEALLATEKKLDPSSLVMDGSAAARTSFLADDGKEFIYDSEMRKWLTPEEKIEEELAMLRDEVDDVKASNELFDDEKPVVPPAATTTNDDDAAATKKRKKKSKSKKNKWVASKQKTWIYINGLPLDATVHEVHDHFAKCGVIQRDLETDEPKIKLYRNKDSGALNGDAAVCFMKEPSVELAIQLLDKVDLRPNWPLDVKVAEFAQKGDAFVPRKKAKLDSRAKVKKFQMEQALSWGAADEDEGLRIVVLKHMFTPADFDDVEAGNELKDDIKAECETLGDVTKITFFEQHPLGVVQVKYALPENAQSCIERMHGRFFSGRKIECAYWDGTNYTVRESQDEEIKRTEEFGAWLEEGSSSDDDDDDDEGSDQENAAPPARPHAGRVLPDSDDEDDAMPMHAGRVLPPMEDEDEDDAMPMHAGRVLPPMDDD
ncbi:hypothetical protein SPRG_07507 [Saprolegnia parasitica CBS 223.65]|uniref:RRM domain-containing protein n=1 Tax=Saprolegnia parasitica (strain CBS 223.65) TaxID=695850 RepID=A0A067C9V6_SAPPC|nr:hypothetical protein SPRG_07507 [Saprolegnia parasitica CBS 223.65]KDO27258.1 hypothetical protein SPRG_07507 [Saprolegnia parasitica CBS 223.65]|eukprot:XP_012202035.1 hypothetical protein SPRG_07507 [Saprolegnia parasitica CBS 223.65]